MADPRLRNLKIQTGVVKRYQYHWCLYL